MKRHNHSHRAREITALLAAAILLFRPGGLRAEGPPTVTPDQVVRDALEHSFQLRAAGKEVEAARARKAQANALGLPSVDVEGRAAQYDGLEESALGPDLVIPAIEERYSVSVGVQQPLFTGGKVRSRRRSAQAGREMAEHDRRAAEADTRLRALTGYWNWSRAFYGLEVLGAAVERMSAHADDVRNLHEAGLALDNDVLSTEVALEQARLRLEEGRRRARLARARIAFLTGNELPEDAMPERAGDLPRDDLPPEADLIETAQADRPEPAAQRKELESAEALIRSARADYFPHAYLAARYESANPNSLFFPPEEKWNDDLFAGIVVSWNLFDSGLTRARTAEARARADQARLQVEQLDAEIALDVREARIDLLDARERVTVTQRALNSARRNLESATDLWRNGLARHSDVLDAEAQLTDAEYQLTSAATDVLLARAALDHATGQQAFAAAKEP